MGTGAPDIRPVRTAEELRAALEQLGWIEEYGDCGQCRPRVIEQEADNG